MSLSDSQWAEMDAEEDRRIRAAVLAERERCARIAESWAKNSPPPDPDGAIARGIAEEIRNV